ncbi:MAG: hypothetical protein M0Z51_09030, partial [Propionibacterium sp.]|nr:hypothetical protein [Propionibacterium sp.]
MLLSLGAAGLASGEVDLAHLMLRDPNCASMPSFASRPYCPTVPCCAGMPAGAASTQCGLPGWADAARRRRAARSRPGRRKLP